MGFREEGQTLEQPSLVHIYTTGLFDALLNNKSIGQYRKKFQQSLSDSCTI